MIQLKSLLKCIDNSGALVVECITVLGHKTVGSLGDEIVCVVKQARLLEEVKKGSTSTLLKLKKGDVARAVIVRAKKEIQRKDGTTIQFDDNACVIINKQGQPVGNRIMGVVAQECRQKRWAKIVSLAPKII